MQASLAFHAGISVLSAAMFLLVGRAVVRRHVSTQSLLARNAFATWWFGLAAVTLTSAVQAGLVGFYRTNLDAFLTVSIALLLALCVSLWGLLFYLLFVFTSQRRLHWAIAGAYAGLFVWLLYLTLAADIQGVDAGRWQVRPVYAHPLEESPLYAVLVALVIGPQFLGAIAYLSLYFQAPDPMQQRRVLLVGSSILVWFGSAGAGSILHLELQDWWQVTSRLIGLAAAATIYYAYAHLGSRPGAPAPQDGDAPRPATREARDLPRRRTAIL